MPPNNPQAYNQPPFVDDEMSPDEAAAALAFATNMSEGLLPLAPVDTGTEQPVEQPSANPENVVQEEINAKITELEVQMEELKQEVKDMIKEEISEIKDAIKSVLAEDEPQEE